MRIEIGDVFWYGEWLLLATGEFHVQDPYYNDLLMPERISIVVLHCPQFPFQVGGVGDLFRESESYRKVESNETPLGEIVGVTFWGPILQSGISLPGASQDILPICNPYIIGGIV